MTDAAIELAGTVESGAATSGGHRRRICGINAAMALGKLPVDVTLVDRKNYHTFQPLLYQVALAVLSPAGHRPARSAPSCAIAPTSRC